MFTSIHTLQSKYVPHQEVHRYVHTLHMQRGKKKSQRPRVSGRFSARRTIQKKDHYYPTASSAWPVGTRSLRETLFIYVQAKVFVMSQSSDRVPAPSRRPPQFAGPPTYIKVDPQYKKERKRMGEE